MQATATFIEVNETLNLAADNPIVGEIRPALEKLYIILKKIYNKLGPDFTNKFNSFCKLYNKSNIAWKAPLITVE